MAAVLQSPPAFQSSPASPLSCASSDGERPSLHLQDEDPTFGSGAEEERGKGGAYSRGRQGEEEQRQQQQQLSVLALLVAVVRKSLVGCSVDTGDELRGMEIGRPTNVRHLVHVTFDRFHGFLGLPVEFEPEVPRRAPSASANVFGVSTESMQCSFDSRGNSVPTILLLMQRRLYALGGLQAEGIFRINAENSQEEHVRDQLNYGVVSENVDIHCLAGLIKCWFRELPTGVLDPLEHEQVMQCQSEEECAQLVRLLPPTEAALLDWAINLMADVVQEEHHNKMNARNIAMVFAPNMTQMADPLTALMYAVQVMNFLKMLIERTLKERHECVIEASASNSGPFDESRHGSPPRLCSEDSTEGETERTFHTSEPVLTHVSELVMLDSNDVDDCSCTSCVVAAQVTSLSSELYEASARSSVSAISKMASNSLKLSSNHIKYHGRRMIGMYSNLNMKKNLRGGPKESPFLEEKIFDKPQQVSILNRINSRAERIEAW